MCVCMYVRTYFYATLFGIVVTLYPPAVPVLREPLGRSATQLGGALKDIILAPKLAHGDLEPGAYTVHWGAPWGL